LEARDQDILLALCVTIFTSERSGLAAATVSSTASQSTNSICRRHRCSLSHEKQLYQPERRHRPYHTPSAPTSITPGPATGKHRAVNLMTQLSRDDAPVPEMSEYSG
jgi:hypothetical protein